MPHLLHYAKSKCRTAAPPHAARWIGKVTCMLTTFLLLVLEIPNNCVTFVPT